MKTAQIVITTTVGVIGIILIAVLVVYSLGAVQEQMEDQGSGQTPVVSLDETAVDLSGGTTDLKYEPEEAVVLDDTVRYNSDNFDLTYHDLNKYAGLYETNLKNVQVRDPSSKRLVTLPYAPAQDLPVYYDISKRVYGPFRPTYADSVLLSHYR